MSDTPWKRPKVEEPRAVVTATLEYKVFAECPNCDNIINLLRAHDEESEISEPLFNNRWDEARVDVICPSCNSRFTVEGVEY